MKAEKKRAGIKAQIRAENERDRRIATAVFLAVILVSAALSAYFGYTILNPSAPADSVEPTLQFKPENPNPELKAAIVDQLSLTFPNQAFVEAAANTLRQAGYTVDYYSGEKVTVGFYRSLPEHGYGFIVLRVHSTATQVGGVEGPVTFFTSERATQTKYVYEELTDRLLPVAYSEEQRQQGITYFGITPSFVTNSMNGGFQNTVVVMMGCQGLVNPSMAQAFVQKGAKAYIGWQSEVSGSRTDTATVDLLRHFVTESLTLKGALQETFKEVGPDPSHGSLLVCYPLEMKDKTMENIRSQG